MAKFGTDDNEQRFSFYISKAKEMGFIGLPTVQFNTDFNKEAESVKILKEYCGRGRRPSGLSDQFFRFVPNLRINPNIKKKNTKTYKRCVTQILFIHDSMNFTITYHTSPMF